MIVICCLLLRYRNKQHRKGSQSPWRLLEQVIIIWLLSISHYQVQYIVLVLMAYIRCTVLHLGFLAIRYVALDLRFHGRLGFQKSARIIYLMHDEEEIVIRSFLKHLQLSGIQNYKMIKILYRPNIKQRTETVNDEQCKEVFQKNVMFVDLNVVMFLKHTALLLNTRPSF